MQRWIVSLRAVMCAPEARDPRDRELVEKDVMFEVIAPTATEACLKLSAMFTEQLRQQDHSDRQLRESVRRVRGG